MCGMFYTASSAGQVVVQNDGWRGSDHDSSQAATLCKIILQGMGEVTFTKWLL